MESATLLLTNGYVVSMDAERRLIRDGAVAVRGDRILAVGRRTEIEAAYTADRTIDAGGNVIMPGLINAHRHLLITPRGSMPEGRTTLQNLKEFVYPAFAALTEEDNYWNAQLAAAEMIRNGTTAFQEPGCTHLPAVLASLEATGLRCSIGPWTWDRGGPGGDNCPDYFVPLSTEEALRHLEDAVGVVRAHGCDRLRAAITMEGVSTCSDALSVGARSLADHLGTISVQHKATSVQEVAMEQKAFGHRPLEHLYRIGALGPNVLLTHMTALDEADVGMVAETGTCISHNPSSALKLSKGVTQTGKFPELFAAGVTVALGTDAENASDHTDIFRAMYLAVLLPRDARIEPGITRAELGLELATRNGSRAIGWDEELGALEPGRKADLIVVETRRPDMTPAVDVVHNLVYSATGSCVTHTIVDGRVLMADRVLSTIDEERALSESQHRAEALLDRIGQPVRSAWPVI